MTDIDPKSDIELHAVNEHVIVRVPLAGRVTDEWLQRYQRLARATGVPVQTQAHPDRTWIVVSVPADGNQREVAATMDAARALIAEADAGERAPAAAQAESIVRDWWARRRESAPRRPVSKIDVARTGIGTEKRWPLLGALAVAIAVPLLLPARFSVGPDWIVPAVMALLLAAIAVADRARDDRRPSMVRALSLALMVVLVAEAAGVTARLVVDLVEGGPETNSAKDLLSVGFGIWLYTILPLPSCTGSSTAAAPMRACGLRASTPTSLSPSSSTRSLPCRAGVLSSSTTSIWLHQCHRIQPDRCDAARPLGQSGHDHAGGWLAPHLGTGDRPGRQYPAVAIPERRLILRGGWQRPVRRADCGIGR